jgi:hypothetical protein
MDTDKKEFDLNSSVFIGAPSVAKNAFLHVFLRALRVFAVILHCENKDSALKPFAS